MRANQTDRAIPCCHPTNTCTLLFYLVRPSKTLPRNLASSTTNQSFSPCFTTKDKSDTSKDILSFSASKSEKNSKPDPITRSSTTWKTSPSPPKTWTKNKPTKSSQSPTRNNSPDNWPRSLKKKLKTKKENNKSSSKPWEIKSSKIKSPNSKASLNWPDSSNKKSMADTPLVSEPSLNRTENKKLPKKLWRIHSLSGTFFWEHSHFSETKSDKTKSSLSDPSWNSSVLPQLPNNLTLPWNSKEKYSWAWKSTQDST